jgi:hypothetical protein
MKSSFLKIFFGITLLVVVILGFLLNSRFKYILTTLKQPKINFVAGEVLVSFKDGVTYKEAKILFQSNNMTQFENGYWKAINKIPTDNTILNPIDFFVVKVPIGDEDKSINILGKSALVKNASLNSIGHVE